MLKIGITGQSGFVGTHLFNTLGLFPNKYERVPFNDIFFSDESLLNEFVCQCDVIIHLAAMSRHSNPKVVSDTNIRLVQQLIFAMESETVAPYVLFSSSVQEECDNEYGKSKIKGRELLEQWAERSGACFTGMVFPNVYGPFGTPNYVSFIATFCHKLTHNETPEVFVDSNVRLIYVGNLVDLILCKIDEVEIHNKSRVECIHIPFDFIIKVTEVLQLLKQLKTSYFDNGKMPELLNSNEVNLFITFHSYIDHGNYFPRKFIHCSDSQGLSIKSFKLDTDLRLPKSASRSGNKIKNLYHTRRIERFTVIKGKARIQLRKIGTEEILDFYLDGSDPTYVDIPVWYTHNITNIGDGELYMQCWINKWYNQDDSDTFFEPVVR
jgi:UDP-2-acetamido-2,6-beta-L-arabino-hexul-4-ose reductase